MNNQPPSFAPAPLAGAVRAALVVPQPLPRLARVQGYNVGGPHGEPGFTLELHVQTGILSGVRLALVVPLSIKLDDLATLLRETAARLDKVVADANPPHDAAPADDPPTPGNTPAG